MLDEYFEAWKAQRAHAERQRSLILDRSADVRRRREELRSRLDHSSQVIDAWKADYKFALGGQLLLVILCTTGVLLPLWPLAEPGRAPSFITPGWLLNLQAVLFVGFGVFLNKVLFTNILDTEKGDYSALVPELADVPKDEKARNLAELVKALLFIGVLAMAADLLVFGPPWLDRMLLAVWRSSLIVVALLLLPLM